MNGRGGFGHLLPEVSIVFHLRGVLAIMLLTAVFFGILAGYDG